MNQHAICYFLHFTQFCCILILEHKVKQTCKFINLVIVNKIKKTFFMHKILVHTEFLHMLTRTNYLSAFFSMLNLILFIINLFRLKYAKILYI
jgi:hypothetical protein